MNRLPPAIRILGIDAAGFESGNPVICAGRTLPWLQDTPAADVWRSWAANLDDVILLDSSNRIFGVYSLCDNTLADSTHYAQLKSLLLSAP